MICHVMDRVLSAKTVDATVLATSIDSNNDILEKTATDHGYACFRGSEDDVLERFYLCAKQYEADIVIRICGDCPLVDPSIIDQLTTAFLEKTPPVTYMASDTDYHDRTFPNGLDCEIFRFSTLEEAHNEATDPMDREHCTRFIVMGVGTRYTSGFITDDELSNAGGERWCVDYPEDLLFMKATFAHFAPRTDFTYKEVYELIIAKPEIRTLNADAEDAASHRAKAHLVISPPGVTIEK